MIVLTWVPRKMRAMIATIAIRARISAYSARPWPSSSRRNEAMSAFRTDMDDGTSFHENSPDETEGMAPYEWPPPPVKARRRFVLTERGGAADPGQKKTAGTRR